MASTRVDVPPRPPSEEPHALEIEYSHAMWAWNRVDDELFAIFIAASGAHQRDIRPLRRAFCKAFDLNARLSMIQAAMREAYRKTRHWEAWNVLRERIEVEADYRSEIANGSGWSFKAGKPRKKDIDAIVPNFWNPEAPDTVDQANDVGWTADEMRAKRYEWSALSREVNEFSCALWREAFDDSTPPPTFAPPGGVRRLPD